MGRGAESPGVRSPEHYLSTISLLEREDDQGLDSRPTGHNNRRWENDSWTV